MIKTSLTFSSSREMISKHRTPHEHACPPLHTAMRFKKSPTKPNRTRNCTHHSLALWSVRSLTLACLALHHRIISRRKQAQSTHLRENKRERKQPGPEDHRRHLCNRPWSHGRALQVFIQYIQQSHRGHRYRARWSDIVDDQQRVVTARLYGLEELQ